MKHHKTNAAIFADARRALLGHLSIAVWSLLLVVALSIFLNQLSVFFSFSNKFLNFLASLAAGFLTSLFISLIGVGLSSIFLNLLYGQPASIRGLLTGFMENSDTCVRVRFFITVGEFVCLMPLHFFLYVIQDGFSASMIPLALIAAVSSMTAYIFWNLTYAMANYLLLDFPDMDARRILRAAYTMMRGNRIRLLMLYLRLLPLHLLGIFSFGLANIWAGCCQYACIAAFYKDMMETRL